MADLTGMARSRPLLHVGLWAAFLSIGLLSVLAAPHVLYPTAGPAKQALYGLLSGSPHPNADYGAMLVFGLTTIGKPMAIIGAILLLEYWVCPRSRDTRQALLICAVHIIFLTTVTVAGLAYTRLGWAPRPLFESTGGTAAFSWQLMPGLLASLIITDFLEYWGHRAQHKFGFLWRFHSIHHALDVDALNNVSHPFDRVLVFVAATVPMMFLFRLPGSHFYLLTAYLSLTSYLNHTRLPINVGPFGALLVDNRYHFVHHESLPGRYNANFAGRFPFIDKLFGTYRKPQDVLPPTGLIDRGRPTTLRHYLLGDLPMREPGDQAGQSPQKPGTPIGLMPVDQDAVVAMRP